MPDDPTPEPELSLVIDINIKDPKWAEAMPHLEALATEVLTEVLKNPASWQHYPNLNSSPVEASVCFADNKTVQDLNRQYREKNSPTNVLSFAGAADEELTEGQSLLLGDVVLAYGVVIEEAKGQGKSLQDHTVHLLIHGGLHLLGFSHDDDASAGEMEGLEIKTLSGLGVADPYTPSQAAGAG